MLEDDKYFITFFSGDQFTSVPRGQFASAEGGSLDWRKGGILSQIFQLEEEIYAIWQGKMLLVELKYSVLSKKVIDAIISLYDLVFEISFVYKFIFFYN